MVELHLLLFESWYHFVANVDGEQIAKELTCHDFSVGALDFVSHSTSVGRVLEQGGHCGFALRHIFEIFLGAALFFLQFSRIGLYLCSHLNRYSYRLQIVEFAFDPMVQVDVWISKRCSTSNH